MFTFAVPLLNERDFCGLTAEPRAGFKKLIEKTERKYKQVPRVLL